VIILDNASIHNCKYIRKFVAGRNDLRLFALPTYSPEYNPTEQVWKWLKSKVCGIPKVNNGGCREIIARIRKAVRAWVFDKLVKKPCIGVGIWQELLFNYL
jgi:transposase